MPFLISTTFNQRNTRNSCASLLQRGHYPAV